MSVRQRVLRDLRANGPDMALIDVFMLGPYLAPRLGRAFNGAATVREFWHSAARLGDATLQHRLLRALQNERSNQCVSTRMEGQEGKNTYHTGDVNERAYQACVALLDELRRHRNVRWGRLPSSPRRSKSARTCGCHTRRDECRRGCVWHEGFCVPQSAGATGFMGVPPAPGQKEAAIDGTRRAEVRRRARTQITQAHRTDPSSLADIAAGHPAMLQYVPRGGVMWRRPSSRIRAPITARPR